MDLALLMAKRMMVGVYIGRQKVDKVSHKLDAWSGNGEAIQSISMQGVARDCHATYALEL